MYAHTHTQSHIHISAYHAQQSCTCIEYRIHIYMHTICTHTNTENDNMQHTEQHTDTSTENSTEQTQYPDTDRTQNSAHNYRTYSFDYYYEFAYINNSNTIELYTISKD